MGIKTVPQPPYGPDLALCDFWLFRKLRDCRYETIEEMKEAVTKVIDTLTQEDFHRANLNLISKEKKFFFSWSQRFILWLTKRPFGLSLLSKNSNSLFIQNTFNFNIAL